MVSVTRCKTAKAVVKPLIEDEKRAPPSMRCEALLSQCYNERLWVEFGVSFLSQKIIVSEFYEALYSIVLFC